MLDNFIKYYLDDKPYQKDKQDLSYLTNTMGDNNS